MEDEKAFTWRIDYSIQITSYIKNCLSFHFDSVRNSIVDELIKTQKKKKNVLWNFTAPKIKHSTTRIDYQNCGLTNVDVFFKMISLESSWFRPLFDNSFHQSKVIPLFFIDKTFGAHFKSYFNLDFSDFTVKCFHSFYKSMFLNWKKLFYVHPCVTSCIINQVLRFNRFIQTNRKLVFIRNSLKMILTF